MRIGWASSNQVWSSGNRTRETFQVKHLTNWAIPDLLIRLLETFHKSTSTRNNNKRLIYRLPFHQTLSRNDKSAPIAESKSHGSCWFATITRWAVISNYLLSPTTSALYSSDKVRVTHLAGYVYTIIILFITAVLHVSLAPFNFFFPLLLSTLRVFPAAAMYRRCLPGITAPVIAAAVTAALIVSLSLLQSKKFSFLFSVCSRPLGSASLSLRTS